MFAATFKSRFACAIVSLLVACCGFPAGAADPPTADAIDYNRDIRPILAASCYACHGPDQAKREAGLRLDKPDTALAALESGGHAIVPGDSRHSKLVERITAADDETV